MPYLSKIPWSLATHRGDWATLMAEYGELIVTRGYGVVEATGDPLLGAGAAAVGAAGALPLGLQAAARVSRPVIVASQMAWRMSSSSRGGFGPRGTRSNLRGHHTV